MAPNPELSDVVMTPGATEEAAAAGAGDMTTMALLCMPVIEILANVVGESAEAVLNQLGLNVDVNKAISMQFKHGDNAHYIKLLTVSHEYETNITEIGTGMPAGIKKQFLDNVGALLFMARVFYLRLIQENPAVFAEYAKKLQKNGKDPKILEALQVDASRTTLFIDRSLPHIGVLIV